MQTLWGKKIPRPGREGGRGSMLELRQHALPNARNFLDTKPQNSVSEKPGKIRPGHKYMKQGREGGCRRN